MSVAGARLFTHAKSMVQEFMVEHEPDEPGRHSGLIQKRMDTNHVLLSRVATQAYGSLRSAHSASLAPGDAHRGRLSKGAHRLSLKQRL